MDATVRATCPKCRSTLRIPAQWLGQAVKCKKCGTVVRSKTPNPTNGAAPAAAAWWLPETGEPVMPPAAVPYPAQPVAVPPGYPAPAAYGVPPAYPYAPPTDPLHPIAVQPYQVPPAYADPSMAAYPATVAVPVAPVPVAPVPQPIPVPVPDAFQPATTSGHRYRRPQKKNTAVWVVLCLLLTGGLVAGGFFLTQHLQEVNGPLNEDPIAQLVALLGSDDAATRDDAFAKLKAQGAKAEEALKVGAKSDNPEVAKRSNELLALLAGTPGNPGAVAKTGPFPRRMLFISISKYMYLNPLTYAEVRNEGVVGEDKTKPAALRLSYEWQIPNDPRSPDTNQLFVLSDSARPDNPRATGNTLPVKNVVTGTYEGFFATSRPQDRVVVYFGGHALEKDGKAYLAPIEGDLDDAEASLIPLVDFYQKVADCKATQKVVIWDVCRFNPQRGKQRPGSEPMTQSLYKALAAAPAGTEVVITCQPGENALEHNYIQEPGSNVTDPGYAGSAFLESLRYNAARGNRTAAKTPAAGDPIPVAEWTATVARRVGTMAGWVSYFGDAAADAPMGGPARTFKQTVKLEGKPRETQTPYDPAEPVAKRFEMPTPPKGVPAAEIEATVKEFSVPPIRRDLADAGVADVAFQESVMKDYKSDATIQEILADREKYKFRAATIDALEKIRKMWSTAPGATGGPKLREKIDAPVSDQEKARIKSEQEFWAFGIAELELLNEELDKVKSLKDGEPKRWQAHYEYARAVLKARLAYMNEYNKLMGDVHTGNLPALDEKAKPKQDSYVLVSSEKMKSNKDVQAIAEEAKEAYETLITEFKGTPWAVQAKRDKSFALGLAWQPTSSGNPTTLP